jgi:hypothetical protein
VVAGLCVEDWLAQRGTRSRPLISAGRRLAGSSGSLVIARVEVLCINRSGVDTLANRLGKYSPNGLRAREARLALRRYPSIEFHQRRVIEPHVDFSHAAFRAARFPLGVGPRTAHAY